jgi:hypothetical protein
MSRVTFVTNQDSGLNESASIQPVVNSDTPIAQNLGRPDENLRARTVRLQAELNKERAARLLAADYIISASTAGTRVQWEGPCTDGSTLGRCVVVAGADLVLTPRTGPGVSRASSLDDGDTALSATRRAYFDIPVDDGSTTGTIRLIIHADVDPLSAAWMSFDLSVSGTGIVCSLEGTDPVSADLGFVPGETRIVVTAATGTTLAALCTALVAQLPAVVASATVTDGDSATEVVDTSVASPTNPGIVGHAIRITATALSTFFAASTSNRLRKGDTLAVWFGDVGDMLRRSAKDDWSTLTSSDLVNLGRDPSRALTCIPICRVDQLGRLCFVGGAVVTDSGAAGTAISGTARAVSAPTSHDQTDFDVPTGSVESQIGVLAGRLQDVLDGSLALHDVTIDQNWTDPLYVPSINMGLTYGAGQDVSGALLESRGTAVSWAHTDTDTASNPGLIFELGAYSARSGADGKQADIQVSVDSGSEPTWAFRTRKQSSSTMRDAIYFNSGAGVYCVRFPGSGSAISAVQTLVAASDGITPAAGFGAATSYNYDTDAAAGGSVALATVGGEYSSSTRGYLTVSTRYSSALTTTLRADALSGLVVYGNKTINDATGQALNVVGVVASGTTGFGPEIRLSAAADATSLTGTLLGVISADIRPSSDGWMYFKAVDNGAVTTVLTLKPGEAVIDGDLDVGDIAATDVTAPSVTATTAVYAPNAAYAWAKVTYSGGSYTYDTSATFGFDTGTAIAVVDTVAAQLTLSTALPVSDGGTGVAVVIVSPIGQARFATGYVKPATAPANKIICWTADTSGTPGTASFQVVVYAPRS